MKPEPFRANYDQPQYPVDKKVPLPQRLSRPKRSKYPLEHLNVTDSFFVPHAKSTSFSGTVQNFRLSHPDKAHWKFTVRTVTENGVEGVRLWRIS